MSDAFERTSCACRDCVACCETQPGSLAPGDFERIADFLGESREQAKIHFWASPGALVADTRTGRTYRIGTITPKRKGGRCVFLDIRNRCRIHPVAPYGCAYFDTHMSAAEGRRRSTPHLLAIARDAEYQALREELPAATSWKPKGY